MYRLWLAEHLQETSVTVNDVRVPSVRVDVEEKFPDLNVMLEWIYVFKSRFAMSPAEMANIYTWMATSDELKNMNSGYFDEKKRRLKHIAFVEDKELGEQLMKLTYQYLDMEPSL